MAAIARCSPESLRYSRLAVRGYELLFRDPSYPGLDGDAMMADVLVRAGLDVGLARLVGTKLAFVNATRAFLLGEHELAFPARQTVVEVLPGRRSSLSVRQREYCHYAQTTSNVPQLFVVIGSLYADQNDIRALRCGVRPRARCHQACAARSRGSSYGGWCS